MTTNIPVIPSEVADHLGYYVYLYVDPRTDRPFYVGKGRRRRVLAHLAARGESKKVELIAELASKGLQPRLEILAHGLESEETAFRVEAAATDLLGLEDLTNVVSGWRSVQLGRKSLEELVTYYAAKPVEIPDPVLLVRINRLYRHGMSATELYEATRGVWKVGERRNAAKLALAVFEGVVREVYDIVRWHPAGFLPYATRSATALKGRWEFEGSVATNVSRDRYRGHSVVLYLNRGSQNPITYVNC